MLPISGVPVEIAEVLKCGGVMSRSGDGFFILGYCAGSVVHALHDLALHLVSKR